MWINQTRRKHKENLLGYRIRQIGQHEVKQDQGDHRGKTVHFKTQS